MAINMILEQNTALVSSNKIALEQKGDALKEYLYHTFNANSTQKDIEGAIKLAHESGKNIKPVISEEAAELHNFIKNAFNHSYIESLDVKERTRLARKAYENISSAFNSKATDKFTDLEEAAIAGLIYLFLPNYN